MKKAFKIGLIGAIVAFVAFLFYLNRTRYFFDFDEVVYYKSKMSSDELAALDSKKVKTVNDSMILRLMGDYVYDSMPQRRAAIYLDSMNFEKKTIPASKYDALREIFTEKTTLITSTTTCEPIYRDIYIFKKNGKISGIARLCYECGQSDIIGTTAYTFSFGQHNEFEELQELVK